MLFSIISLLVCIVAFVWLFTALRATGISASEMIKWWRHQFKYYRTQARANGWLNKSSLRNLSYFFALDFLLILGITGFIQPWLFIKPMSGLLLMLHLTVAPLFSLALLFFVLFWAHKQRLVKEETSLNLRLKICFWTTLILASSAIIAIGLSMFPLAGTQAQIILLAVHKYVAVALIAAVIVYSFYAIRMFMQKND
ncbi:MAG: hypothetical protein DWQ10_07325 [Calditrichaeota bacterium]|nr:MAG: hypothetical protein DWQ10_07325 [Calditrichota bacterium]